MQTRAPKPQRRRSNGAQIPTASRHSCAEGLGVGNNAKRRELRGVKAGTDCRLGAPAFLLHYDRIAMRRGLRGRLERKTGEGRGVGGRAVGERGFS